MLQTTVKNAKEEFDRVFIELGHDSKLEIANKNEVRFFMLDIKNNQYSYYEMFSILHSNLGRYALSRKEFQKDPETAISRGISRFHEVKGSGTGAGGEMICTPKVGHFWRCIFLCQERKESTKSIERRSR